MRIGLVLALMFFAATLSSSAQSSDSSPASGQGTAVLSHARGVVNIQQNQNYLVRLKWAAPFADNKYTASCTPIAPSGFQGDGYGVYLFQVTQISPASVQVEVAAIGTGALRIDCIALHD